MKEMLQRLFDEFGRANQELRALVDGASAEKRDLTAEEQEKLERINTELDELESRIKTVKDRLESEANVDAMKAQSERFFHAAGASGDGQPDPEEELAKRTVAFFRGQGPNHLDISLKGLKVIRDERSGRNVVREVRAGLNEGSLAAGDATVPISFRAVLYQHLIQLSAVRQTRATVLTTSTGEPLLLPKTTAHPASGTIVAEGAAINENDPAFGQGTLHAYKYANLVQISRELETDTAVDLLGYLAMAMGRALGIGSGHDYVLGSGSSQPEGFLVGAGTVAQTVGGTGQAGVPTYRELESIFDSIIPPYQANAEWIMSQKTVSALRQITDTLGRPLWLPGLAADMPNQLFGKPYYIDPAMPNAGTAATSIAFGDFAAYFIRDVDGLRFERSVDYAFNTDLLTYRAILRTDGLLLDKTGAIGTYKGGTA